MFCVLEELWLQKWLTSALEVWRLANTKRIAIRFDNFLIFQLTILPMRWLDFWLQHPSVTFLSLRGKMEGNENNFAPSVAIMKALEWHNASKFVKSVGSTTYFSLTTGLRSSNKVANEKFWFCSALN